MRIIYHTPSSQTVVTSAVGLVKGDTGSLLPAQAALVSDAIAARDAVIGYETRAEAAAASVPSVVKTLRVGGLSYRRDAAGTALTTADGQRWSPADPVPTVKHYAQPLNLNNNDAPAVNALIAEAAARGDREVHINSPVRAMTPIELYGGIVTRWGGPITWAGGAGHVVGIVDRDLTEKRGVVEGMEIVGNDQADIGFKCPNVERWTFSDMRVADMTKAGAWGVDLTGLPDNRAAVSCAWNSLQIENCDNLLLLDNNPLAHYTAEPNFHVFNGGRGNFGRNDKNWQYGVRVRAGEGNKFINWRVTTTYEWVKRWDVHDARTTLLGCAADGMSGSAFIWFLAGTTGTLNGITLLGTNLMSTPVQWQGSREATALAVVAQIEAEGKQYPATPYRASAYGAQVVFHTVDANDNDVRITNLSSISVPKTGDITFGHSGLSNGIVAAGAPYVSFPDVTSNEWGQMRGRGGARHSYGFFLNAGSSGELVGPEGNGTEHQVYFDAAETMRGWNIIHSGRNIQGNGGIATDANMVNLDGYIQAYLHHATPGTASVTHSKQMLRIINEGAFITAMLDVVFVPTFTAASQFYLELPQKGGVETATEPHDTSGLPWRLPIEAAGLGPAAAGRTITLLPQPGSASPNGLPFFRVSVSDGQTSALMSSAHMVSGQQVTLRGQVRYPVNRFK